VADDEVIAQELSGLGEKVRGLETRMAEVEKVNARLEDAALTTARALQEISGHWNAVYEAMRREEEEDSGSSSQRDHAASKARRQPEAASTPPDH
jgi:hypothetical protein